MKNATFPFCCTLSFGLVALFPSCDQNTSALYDKSSPSVSEAPHLRHFDYTRLTNEEAGYLDHLIQEHLLLYESAHSFLSSDASPSTRRGYYVRILTEFDTLRPMVSKLMLPVTMREKHFDLRSSALHLIDAVADQVSEDELLRSSKAFIDDLEEFQNVTLNRDPFPVENKLDFIIRPFNQPFMVLDSKGKAVISLSTQTPLGGVVVWKERRSFTNVKYLIIRMNGKERIMRFRDNYSVSFNTDEPTEVKIDIEGENIVMSFSSIYGQKDLETLELVSAPQPESDYPEFEQHFVKADESSGIVLKAGKAIDLDSRTKVLKALPVSEDDVPPRAILRGLRVD